MKMSPIWLLVWLIALTHSVFGFVPIDPPGFLSKSKAEAVSKITNMPSFSQRLKSLNTPAHWARSALRSAKSADSDPQKITLGAGMARISTDAKRQSFFTNVTIQDKEFPLIIDTGSLYVWVYSSDCASHSSACSGPDKQRFDASSSALAGSAYSADSGDFQLTYSAGTVNGSVVTGPLTVAQFIVKMGFGAADYLPDSFSPFPISGVLGLPSRGNVTGDNGMENLVAMMTQSGDVKDKVFSVALGSRSVSEDHQGIITFGSEKILPELYTGDIRYGDIVDSSSLWKIVMTRVYASGAGVSFGVDFGSATELPNGETSKQERVCIVDTGSSLLLLPPSDANVLHSYFDKAFTDGTNYALPCDTKLEFELEIFGRNFTLGPEDYVGAAYSEDSAYAGFCVSNIQAYKNLVSNSEWVIGGVFLSKVYAVFDMEQRRLGFADRNFNVVIVDNEESGGAEDTETGVVTTSADIPTTVPTTLVTQTVTSESSESSESTESSGTTSTLSSATAFPSSYVTASSSAVVNSTASASSSAPSTEADSAGYAVAVPWGLLAGLLMAV